jgi:hypothetical protein
VRGFRPDGEQVEPDQAGRRDLRVSAYEVARFARLALAEREKHQQEGIDPELGFHELPEWERTRHVHRLHPYQGKFIPQLAEHFLHHHGSPGGLVLDPFMGSGTTLVQAHEMGLGAAGVEISQFNCTIAQVKLCRYEEEALRQDLTMLVHRVESTPARGGLGEGERLLHDDYMRRWFSTRSRRELAWGLGAISRARYPDLLRVVLSRAARSARLVPHFDLASAQQPVEGPYWCHKHRRTCQPVDEALRFVRRYARDAERRIHDYARLRSDSQTLVLHGDSRTLDLQTRLPRPVSLVFSSPPYVGQIDYHEQHRYAYALFGIPMRQEEEIGRRAGGKSRRAQDAYVEGVAAVLRNLAPVLAEEALVLLVANDTFGLYPRIAETAGFTIVHEDRRAVSKRTERDRTPYHESIFHLRRGV